MNRKILITVIIILVILGVGIFYVLFPDFFRNDKITAKPAEQDINKEVPVEVTKEPRTITLKPINSQEQTKQEVQKFCTQNGTTLKVLAAETQWA